MDEARSQLLKICKDQVSLDPQHDKVCQKVFKKVLDTVISEAKRVSPEFKEVYYGKYKGGSYFDGLQVKCKNNDFDVNIIFKLPPTSWKLDNLCDDVRRPNFAHMRAKEQTSGAWKLLEGGNSKGQNVISPKKMKKLLHQAVTGALTALGHKVEVGGVEYRVTRQDGTPVILKVEGPKTQDPVKFTVDLVPAFELGMKHLSIDMELETRVKNVMKLSGKTTATFMAIALDKASSDQFELDFHVVERALLDSRPETVFKVIKLMKHLRNERGSNLLKLKSHLLKTVVMHRVLETDVAYWRQDNIDACFSDCVKSLAEMLRSGSVVDVFFPQFNMVDLIEEKTVPENCANFLDKALREAKTPSELFLPRTLSYFKCSTLVDSRTSGGSLRDKPPLAQEEAHFKCSTPVDSMTSGGVLRAEPPLTQEEETKRRRDPITPRLSPSADSSLIMKESEVSKTCIKTEQPFYKPPQTQTHNLTIELESQRVEAEVESQLHRGQDLANLDTENASTVEVEAEEFCKICDKRVGKENWASHINGKDHCKKKRRSKDKDTLLHLVQKTAKPQVASGVKRPNSKGQVQHTQEKKSKSKTTTSNLLSSSRLPPVHETVSSVLSSTTINANVKSESVINKQWAEKFPSTGQEKEALAISPKFTNTTRLTDKVKITWLPSSNTHDWVETITKEANQSGSRPSAEIVADMGSHQKVEEIKKQERADDLATSLEIYVKPPDGFVAGEEMDGKTGLDSILEEIESLADEEEVIPKERARALDQGLAEICTTAAVGNSCVEDLHPERDVLLDEFLGGLKQVVLKQGKEVDLWNGNNVEDFDGALVTKMMDQTSKAYGNVLIKTKRLTKENINEKGQLVLVYLRKKNDPSTMHCVYLKRFHFCENNATLKEDLCEAINSWGDLDPKLYIPARQKGNRFYKVTTEWSHVGPIENLTSTLPTSATNTSTSDSEPSLSQEIMSENEEPNRCMIS